MRKFQLVISCGCMGGGQECIPFTVSRKGDMLAAAEVILEGALVKKHRACGGMPKVNVYVFAKELKFG